jgi:hypothetical protein
MTKANTEALAYLARMMQLAINLPGDHAQAAMEVMLASGIYVALTHAEWAREMLRRHNVELLRQATQLGVPSAWDLYARNVDDVVELYPIAKEVST